MAKKEKPVAELGALPTAIEKLTALDAASTQIVVEEIEALKGEITTYEEELAALRAKLDVQDSEKKIGKPIIVHEGKKYALMIPSFSLKGNTYNEEKLKNDKATVALLIEKKSSVLTLIND